MFMEAKESELIADLRSTICMMKIVWWLCDVCVFVFVACYQLTNGLVETGDCFIEWGIMGKVGGPRGRTVPFTCDPEHLGLSKGTLCLNC